MRFLVISAVFLWSQSFLLCGADRNEKNATEVDDLIRIRFNDTDRYSNQYNETSSSEPDRTIESVEEDTDRTEDLEHHNVEEAVDEAKEEDKFVSPVSDIILEQIDFITLRLNYIANQTSSNITELRILQQQEFEKNEVYEIGWEAAVKMFNSSTRKELLDNFSNDSIVAEVPDEYHIALIAYSLQIPTPALYSDFNRKTREMCSGTHILNDYHYKTYFKFLLLAIDALGQDERFQSHQRFLYRGVGSSKFSLEVGQILAFQHFLSTSADLKIAENFSEKTLFEVQGKYDTAISIEHHSLYSGEKEFLFSPFQIYEVESKHEGKHYTRYVLIAHKLPKSDACTKGGELSHLQNEGVNSGALSCKGYADLIVWVTVIVNFMKIYRY